MSIITSNQSINQEFLKWPKERFTARSTKIYSLEVMAPVADADRRPPSMYQV